MDVRVYEPMKLIDLWFEADKQGHPVPGAPVIVYGQDDEHPEKDWFSVVQHPYEELTEMLLEGLPLVAVWVCQDKDTLEQIKDPKTKMVTSASIVRFFKAHFDRTGPEPKNNDGREFCFWCAAPTVEVNWGMRIEHRMCPNCKR